MVDVRNAEGPTREMVAVLKAMSGAERLRISSRMFASARRMLLAHLHQTHPDWGETQISQEAARRLSHGAVRPDESCGECLDVGSRDSLADWREAEET